MAVDALADGAEESGGAVWVGDFGEGAGELVGVDQLGVSEDARGLAEVLLDELGVHVDLLVELILGVEE
ncbi:MAG: hypothetical protein R3B67_09655 [Phycisphaerales bacterium]